MDNQIIMGIIIKKGLKKINENMEKFKEEEKLYNQIVKENQNLFLRSTYVERGKKKYNYWYRYEWDKKKKRTIHKYIGKIRPNEEIPDPPEDHLQGIDYKEIKGTEDIILSIKEYDQYKEFFKNCEIQFIITRNTLKEKIKENS